MTSAPGGSRPVQATFVTSAVAPAQYPSDGLPELALVGRSNVGKSSLINALAGMRKLARTSNQPGRTQTLNFYRLTAAGQSFYCVDMPGYGYARVSRTTRAEWSRFIEAYLNRRSQLVGVIQVLDLRHAPSQDDVTMWEWLRHFGKPRLAVATKADKISRGRWPDHRRMLMQGLSLGADEELVLFSAATRHGGDDVWRWILSRVSTTPDSR